MLVHSECPKEHYFAGFHFDVIKKNSERKSVGLPYQLGMDEQSNVKLLISLDELAQLVKLSWQALVNFQFSVFFGIHSRG